MARNACCPVWLSARLLTFWTDFSTADTGLEVSGGVPAEQNNLRMPHRSGQVITTHLGGGDAMVARYPDLRALTASTVGVGSPPSVNRSMVRPASRKAWKSAGRGRWVAPTLSRTPWSVQDALVQWPSR
jgi:hypothetical protein